MLMLCRLVGSQEARVDHDPRAEDGSREYRSSSRDQTIVLIQSVPQRFAETRLSDLICQNEAVALEFEVYGKNAITRESQSTQLVDRL